MINLRGVGVALITPFTESDQVDYTALGQLLDYVKMGGVDYLVVFGTTAETPTLTPDEKTEILAYVKNWNKSVGLPIVLGMGGNNSAALCSQIKEFDFDGISAILSVTPFYNKPSQEGIYGHYKAVSEVSPVPIILYNVPSRTGVNMSAATALRLANEFDNIIAIKEASGNLCQAAYIIKDAPAEFYVISGDDNLSVPMIALGGDGVISVAANAFASDFCDAIHYALDGEDVLARSKYYKLLEATDLLLAEGNPVGVKAALSVKKITSNLVRLPLVAASPQLTEKIQNEIEKYKI
ncbi:MAG: 4-hydroxy-tetrahydrodipicolinate synthase [Rikenellaceae bacterium]